MWQDKIPLDWTKFPHRGIIDKCNLFPNQEVISIDILDYLSQKGVRLTPQQQQGLSLSEEPLLLLAVPGSGKTTVLVSRVAAQLLGGIPAGKLLNLTFSRESARDMAARFGSLFPELPPPRFSTIHSLCYSVLRAYADGAGRMVPTLTGSEGAPTSGQLLRQAAAGLGCGYLEDEDLEDLLNQIGLIKNRMLPLNEVGNLSGEFPLPQLYTRYQAEKSRLGLMDYDDILLYAHTFLQKLPELLHRFQRHYPYLNVDESQDISPVQLSILRLLSPEGKGLFMVGDEDQSIYGFRGAGPEGILQFTKLFPTGQVVRMEQNFRSRPEILARCGQFIALSPERYDKALLPSRDSRPGAVVPFRPETGLQAMERILQTISQLKEGESLGILYRNNLSAYLTVDLLLRAEVPFTVTASSRALERFHVRDVCSILRAAEDPLSRERLAVLSPLDFDGGGGERARLTESWDGKKPIWKLLTETGGEKTGRLGRVLEEIRGMKPAEALRVIERQLRTGKYFLAKILSGDDPPGALRAVVFKELCARAATSEELFSRMETLESYIAAPPQVPEASVHLSTIHVAKGLEFDHVLLLDCIDGILPNHPPKGVDSETANHAYYEEMRLFYVAATRARETLTLFYPAKCDRGLSPSRFLSSFLDEPAEKPARSVFRQFVARVIPSHNFRPGDRVIHKTLGEGKIRQVKGDTVTIDFPKGEVTLSLSYCLEKGLLTGVK